MQGFANRVHSCPCCPAHLVVHERCTTRTLFLTFSLRSRTRNQTHQRQDDNNNPLVTEFGLSEFQDYQQVTMQEMPERAPAGQMPDSVDIILLKELVGQLKVCSVCVCAPVCAECARPTRLLIVCPARFWLARVGKGAESWMALRFRSFAVCCSSAIPSKT